MFTVKPLKPRHLDIPQKPSALPSRLKRRVARRRDVSLASAPGSVRLSQSSRLGDAQEAPGLNTVLQFAAAPYALKRAETPCWSGTDRIVGGMVMIFIAVIVLVTWIGRYRTGAGS
ncbi:hypothetical protein N2603_40375 [Bradyrhizobium huanghuaihaiense]|uniref:hypothetical protein n=1 Tax=Bradyrhizobium huanghuaihaiense TaxID=990078 RepID=UPI0021AA15F0|nr:hypothetical protein [Bradyrhizobium sp. CB3035]UWU76104.1 hypothetical protein N2603_40375 [Bradyrhizobium sp. CB3035]